MNKQEALKLVDMPLGSVIELANKERKIGVGNHIEVCSVINAKSGSCGEDCKFCAQSAHYATDVPEYSLKRSDEIIQEAITAKKNGAGRFGIVTSGNKLTPDEISMISDVIRKIKNEVGIVPCASLGALDETAFDMLTEAGLSRYHHNIETSERFYPSIVSTHDYSERVNTIRLAKGRGLEVCAGGILGLGETWEDRIDMAILLNDLEVDAVPMNFLVPIKGTPLENAEKISPLDAIRSIAIFRIILKNIEIKIVAGRETILKDFQGMMYNAGANGMMIGGYLTIAGRSVKEDQFLINEVKKLWNEESGIS